MQEEKPELRDLSERCHRTSQDQKLNQVWRPLTSKLVITGLCCPNRDSVRVRRGGNWSVT